MPGCEKLIDPSKDALTHWLNNARLGDQCQVVTAQGDVYAHLTKLKPATVKLPMTGFTGQDNFLSNKIRFMELLENLGNFDVQS
jgi:hypothetical protein